MAKKGLLGFVSTSMRRLFTGHEGMYHLLKKIAYFWVSLFSKLRIFSPRDLAYRLFPPRPPQDAGYVTKVNRAGISGIAFPSGNTPAMVELSVDGQLINRSWAGQKVNFPSVYAGRMIGFYFPMTRVWQHIQRDWKIEVRADGRPLRYLAGPGQSKDVPNRGVSQLEEKSIIQLVNEGRLITKFGRIQAPRNESESWAAKAFGNYAELNATFERLTGKSLFAFYGVLLGYAREGGVLAHDMDLDLAYFSKESEPDKVRREFKAIAAQLIDAGVEVEPHTYKLQFGGRGLSVTPCWLSNTGFSSTFGYVGDGFTVEPSDIFPLQRKEHMGYGFLLPHNAVAVAKYLYGRGWKYPDPGWKWLPEYKNRPEILAARMREADLRELRDLRDLRNRRERADT